MAIIITTTNNSVSVKPILRPEENTILIFFIGLITIQGHLMRSTYKARLYYYLSASTEPNG